MALLDIDGSSSATLVTAAMESAGIGIQADMLRWVNGDGLVLAGLLYLLAIVGAVFAVAAGGQYLWGRYLLIGPPLFFFLTQVPAELNGSKWKFADEKFDEQHVQLALRDTGYTGRADVALFFKFWNNFTSGVTQELLELLKLTEDGSHLDFLTKTERYMNSWLVNKSNLNPNLHRFIRLIMVDGCASYYMMQMALADPHVDDVEKQTYIGRLQNQKNDKVFSTRINVENGNEMERWLVQNGVLKAGETYNCDQIWDIAVNSLKAPTEEKIEESFTRNPGIGQEIDEIRDKYLKKIGTQTSRATQETLTSNGEMLQAVHWVVARSLWHEITTINKASSSYNFEGHSAFFASKMVPVGGAPQTAASNTNSAIRQFARTETFQFKADFVNAAMALPHFQGVGLLMLAAAYPFFAMAVVLPSRAGAMLTWMGLWAWLKLWDVGFGVVMIIDNIMYTLFPRGPALSAGDMDQAGTAFVKMMEQDPGYNSAMYYNMIAVCMYAVPIATGVFVKGAGSSFVGLLRNGWQGHSTRLAGSAASFGRALQGQSYVGRQRRQQDEVEAQARSEMKNSAWYQQMQAQLQQIAQIRGALEGGGTLTKALEDKNNALYSAIGGGVGIKSSEWSAKLQAEQNKIKESMLTSVRAYSELRAHQHSSGPVGWNAAESAVAAKYYSHDTANTHPGGSLVAAALARRYMSQESQAKGAYDPLFAAGGNMVDKYLPGGSSGK